MEERRQRERKGGRRGQKKDGNDECESRKTWEGREWERTRKLETEWMDEKRVQ